MYCWSYESYIPFHNIVLVDIRLNHTVSLFYLTHIRSHFIFIRPIAYAGGGVETGND